MITAEITAGVQKNMTMTEMGIRQLITIIVVEAEIIVQVQTNTTMTETGIRRLYTIVVM